MGKKKQIEDLENQVKVLKEKNKKLESDVFAQKFNLVVDTLKSMGHCDYQIDFENHDFCDRLEQKAKYTFTLHIVNRI